jgi:hypothetical protein
MMVFSDFINELPARLRIAGAMKGRFVMETTVPKRILPPQPSLDHLRREAKRELAVLRSRSAAAQLSDAQLVTARAYGFSSWRAMKQEVDRRRETLGLLPPAIMGDFIYYRPNRPAGRALVQSSVDAEQTFFRVVTFPFLAAPPAQALGMLILFLFG